MEAIFFPIEYAGHDDSFVKLTVSDPTLTNGGKPALGICIEWLGVEGEEFSQILDLPLDQAEILGKTILVIVDAVRSRGGA